MYLTYNTGNSINSQIHGKLSTAELPFGTRSSTGTSSDENSFLMSRLEICGAEHVVCFESSVFRVIFFLEGST